jgi:hypothetical protein
MNKEFTKYFLIEVVRCEGCPLNGQDNCEGDPFKDGYEKFQSCDLPKMTHVLIDTHYKKKGDE